MTIYQLQIEGRSCRQGNHNACSSFNHEQVVKVICICAICSGKHTKNYSEKVI